MKKAVGRLIIGLIIVGVLSFLIGSIVDRYTTIVLPDNMSDFQFNIITITTVFAGFSFSVLGVLISLSSTKVMKKLEETSELQKSCDILSYSIVVFMVTFFFALFFVLGIIDFLELNFMLKRWIPFSIELGYLLFGIFLFLFSVYRMAYMMYYIFSDSKNNAKKKVDGYIHDSKIIKENMKNFNENNEW